jgi:hypothetical protein
MSKKKQPVFSIQRTLSVQFTLTRNVMEGIIQSIIEDLTELRPGEKMIGVGVKNPLVVALKRLSKEYDRYGDELLDELSPTDQDLAAIADLIPAEIPQQFVQSLENWYEGEGDEFYWPLLKTQQERKAFVEQFSNLFLPRLLEILKRLDEEQEQRDEEDHKRAEEARKAPIVKALDLLKAAGYTITAPVKAKAAKKART